MPALARWGTCILCVALVGCVEGGIRGDAGEGDAGTIGGPIRWCPALATCDDGDPCTDGDLCEDGLCVGAPRVCDTPPGQCFQVAGACSEGACEYPTREGNCDDDDACTFRDRCADGVCAGTRIECQAPPRSRCVDASTLRVFVESGLCEAGRCLYDPVDTLCAGGSCRAGACECTPESPTSAVVQSGLGVSGALEPALLVDDSSDELHLSFHDPVRRTLRYAHRPAAGVWSNELVDPTTGSGLGSDLETRGEDLYIVYERTSPAGVWLASRRAGTLAWRVERVADSGGRERSTPTLAVGLDGALHVAYSSSTSMALRKMAYSHRTTDDWQHEVLDAEGDTGLDPEIWLGAGVEVIYREADQGRLRTAAKLGGPWTAIALSMPASRLHVAAADRDGGIHVVFGDPGSPGWIYARRDRAGAPWVQQPLPVEIDIEGDLALWAAPGGEVHLSYRAGAVTSGGAVSYRYAFRSRSGLWSDREIATFEASGSGTAIAVDSTGRAHIALHDGSSGALQVFSLRVCE